MKKFVSFWLLLVRVAVLDAVNEAASLPTEVEPHSISNCLLRIVSVTHRAHSLTGDIGARSARALVGLFWQNRRQLDVVASRAARRA